LYGGDATRALVDFDAALKLTPDDASLYFNRGVAHARLGAKHKAIADYTEAIRLKPDFAIALYNRGGELERLGDLNAALADYVRATELAPQLKPAADAVQRIMRGRS